MGMHRIEKRKLKVDRRAACKPANRKFKLAERKRRDARMSAKVKAGGLPYTPDVMSWLSAKLDIPSRKITAKDVAALNL